MLGVLYSSSNEEMLSSCGQTQTDTVYMLAATSCFLVTAKSASCRLDPVTQRASGKSFRLQLFKMYRRKWKTFQNVKSQR